MTDYYLDKEMCACIGYVESEDEQFVCAHLQNFQCTFFTEPRCEYVKFYEKTEIDVK